MITLFRRIRQKLIESGSVTRYLLYALGEIALVMIGILLALQVNNWNQYTNERKIADEYVQLLLTDLKADTLMLQTLMDESLVKHDDAQRLMKLWHEDINEFEDTLSVFMAIQDIGRTNSPSFRNNTYNDMVNTGSIKLIKDRTTVDALMTYYTRDISDWQNEYIERLWREYLPIAIDLLPSAFLEDIVRGDIGADTEIRLDRYFTESGRTDPEQILRSFKQNEKMDFLLKSVSRTHLVHIVFLTESKEQAITALKELEKER
ncbi:DUF6090 family protein [Balneola sp. MJW-20]|uniref:DUF6090 family protein n=1 Tax=Gracilimonas aurantiaca TaxID=3234185 RepID=UPI003465A4BF